MTIPDLRSRRRGPKMDRLRSTDASLLRRISIGPRGSYLDALARASAKAVMSPLLGAIRPGNIAMLHVGRVGSTLLGNMLNQHRRICWRGEIFEKAHARYLEAVEAGRTPPKIDALKMLRAEMHNARSRMFGFETKFLDEHHLKVIELPLEDYMEALFSLKFNYFIVATRKNSLRRLVSAIALRDTGLSHLPASERPQKSRVTIDVTKVPLGGAHLTITELFKLIEDGQSRLAKLLPADSVCYVNYEEHVQNDPMIGYRRIMTFLPLEPGTPEVRLRRTNPYPLTELIENFEEVEKALSGTPYHWMLWN